MKWQTPLIALLIASASCSNNVSSVEMSTWDTSINFGWKFSKGEIKDAESPSFDDSSWESVNIPHDWAISGPFGAPEADGSTGKLPWKGEGWYRKTFSIPAEAKGKRLELLFDGVMASPDVYLNGKLVGSWNYGYNSFWIDATDAALFGATNTLTVHADTRDHASRWYPGAGIYRKISIRYTESTFIPVWGVFISTPSVDDDQATVSAVVDVTNSSSKEEERTLSINLFDANNNLVGFAEKEIIVPADETISLSIDVNISNPTRWDVDNPYLYTCATELKKSNTVVQRQENKIGIRTFEWTADDGFHLNGRRVQLKGVDLHHDQGPLGAAFFPRAMERQLEIMKEMGVNALRTSHNACAPEVLDLCDRMGIIVYNELFDKWDGTAGVTCSIEEFVAEYAEREVKNFVYRDRNHPCVFSWSIGNEIWDVLSNKDGKGEEHITNMVGYFKKYDTTRPISMGCCQPEVSVGSKHIIDALETSGWNYSRRYNTTRQAYPDMPLLYTESASAFGTRGAYKLTLPKHKEDWGTDGEINAYMMTSATWSDIPEIEFEYMRIDTFMAGEFVWTGFDYLGEPTPFSGKYTTDKGVLAHTSYFGIVDLAGLPKDSYYNYRSLWNDKNTVYLTPHWNWEGYEGKNIPVFLYTNGDEAELFVNGKSMGREKKIDPSSTVQSRHVAESLDFTVTADNSKTNYFDIIDAYRIRWNNVKYEPGEIKAVAYKDGKVIGESVVRTAGKAAALKATADRSMLKADGMDLCYVTIEMVDDAGVPLPLAMDKLEFNVEGAAQLMGVANGNQIDHDSFTDNSHSLFYGKAVAVLRNIPDNTDNQAKQANDGEIIHGTPGEATLTISTSDGKQAVVKVTFD